MNALQQAHVERRQRGQQQRLVAARLQLLRAASAVNDASRMVQLIRGGPDAASAQLVQMAETLIHLGKTLEESSREAPLAGARRGT